MTGVAWTCPCTQPWTLSPDLPHMCGPLCTPNHQLPWFTTWLCRGSTAGPGSVTFAGPMRAVESHADMWASSHAKAHLLPDSPGVPCSAQCHPTAPALPLPSRPVERWQQGAEVERGVWVVGFEPVTRPHCFGHNLLMPCRIPIRLGALESHVRALHAQRQLSVRSILVCKLCQGLHGPNHLGPGPPPQGLG